MERGTHVDESDGEEDDAEEARAMRALRDGEDWICIECEMRDLARHLARRRVDRPSEALGVYLGRQATKEEAEAFDRYYLKVL